MWGSSRVWFVLVCYIVLRMRGVLPVVFLSKTNLSSDLYNTIQSLCISHFFWLISLLFLSSSPHTISLSQIFSFGTSSLLEVQRATNLFFPLKGIHSVSSFGFFSQDSLFLYFFHHSNPQFNFIFRLDHSLTHKSQGINIYEENSSTYVAKSRSNF